jgi:CRISPR-associated endonuclease Cas2
MSAEIDILEYLSKVKKTIKYKGIKVGLFGLPDFKYYKYQTLANRCHILKQKGFINETMIGEYFITNKGKLYLEKQKNILKKFETQNSDNSPKDLLIVYDIEEKRKKEREWFRFHLKKFHFIMIQRSVWVGPSPLSKEFTEYLKEIKLNNNLKTFKLARGYEKKIL